jgi:hypothetical protein
VDNQKIYLSILKKRGKHDKWHVFSTNGHNDACDSVFDHIGRYKHAIVVYPADDGFNEFHGCTYGTDGKIEFYLLPSDICRNCLSQLRRRFNNMRRTEESLSFENEKMIYHWTDNASRQKVM